MAQQCWRDALIKFIRTQARPLDKFSHQPRLYELAKRLAGNSAFDDDVLFAAAWLHDLGVFVGHRPEDPRALASWDHVSYACRRAPALLEQFGFPAEKITAVTDVIASHLPAGAPTSPEGILLRDADILEQLGAVGILRTVSKVGRDTRFALFSDALRVLQKNATELPSLLRLELARTLSEPRVKLLKEFLSAAEAEAGDAEGADEIQRP